MTQALYRRYRPQGFGEVIGQDHVAATLRNALRQGRLGHAYLFTGPRGTGKTSTARILAKAVNCQAEDIDARPDNTCPICVAINEGRLLDLIEIDAASNTSVDDVRELRDRVAFSPSEARYKVYVIDEVHMLSTSAFNALLKTLEEPPAHVIFILATTEPHKIPATVLSRCQRFDFHRIGSREIAAHLSELADRESVAITPEAVAIIARSATGSMRDAISLLDQITAYGHETVDAELVRDVLGMVSGSAVSELTDAIAAHDPALVLARLHGLIGQGVELGQLVAQLIDHFRTLLLLNVGKDPNLVDLPDGLVETLQEQARRFSPAHMLHIIRLLNDAGLAMKTPFAGYLTVELALLDAAGLDEAESQSPPAAPVASRKDPEPAPVTQRAPTPPIAKPTTPAPPAKPENIPAELDEGWKLVIKEMRTRSPRVQAMLRSGTPVTLTANELIISFRFPFHREQAESAIDLVIQVVSEVFGRPLSVRLVDETQSETPAAAPPAQRSSPAPRNIPDQSSIADDPVVRSAIEDLGAQLSHIEDHN